MTSYNNHIIAGNLGKDPEGHTFQDGSQVANFSVATSEKWTSKDGSQKERTDWHNVVCRGRTAENVLKYLHKGSPVLVSGPSRTRSYDANDGGKRYVTELHALTVQFLGSGVAQEQPTERTASQRAGVDADVLDDDLPF